MSGIEMLMAMAIGYLGVALSDGSWTGTGSPES